MAGKTFRSGLSTALGAALLAFALASPCGAAIPVFEQPNWSALNAEQKTVLAPLSGEWNAMDAFRRKKWLGIAQRYPDMTPAEQASMQRNMREWARLAPEERKAAREKYKALKKAPPEQKQAVKQKWDEYNALPQEERDQLRSGAAKRPQVKTPTKPPASSPVTQPSISAQKIPPSPPRSPLSPLKPPASPLLPKPAKPTAAPTSPTTAPVQPAVKE